MNAREYLQDMQNMNIDETSAGQYVSLVGKLNALLFNLQENETMTQFLARRVPSAGGMLAGYLVGFQRG